MPSGLTLMLASVRLPPGLLTRDAWRALEDADQILARDAAEPLAEAVIGSALPVGVVGSEAAALARHLVTAAATSSVVWLGSADGDPGLTDAIALEVSRQATPPTVEVLVGSWDPPGARLLDVVAVMDRLRSEDGCPWDAEQTHASLAPYLLEEAQEAVEAIASGDRAHLAEELGDVLLQVAFHARVAEEDPEMPFDIDTVAATLVAKLLRRHPHVFADGEARTAADVEREWARIKAAERADAAAAGAAAVATDTGSPTAALPVMTLTEGGRR